MHQYDSVQTFSPLDQKIQALQKEEDIQNKIKQSNSRMMRQIGE